MTLTVGEAAATYERAMRNVLPAGEGICSRCHTFIDPTWNRCFKCNNQPDMLDGVVPITYSEHLSQMHSVLRGYKEQHPPVQHYMLPRIASILWLFLEQHERCIALAAGAQSERFDVVVTVPSSTTERDEQRGNFRWIVSRGCGPTRDRYERALRPTDEVPEGREFDGSRYTVTGDVDGLDVLLVDDTWAAGGHAQSAGYALKAAGARSVGLVVIGRHVRPDWRPVREGPTSHEILDGLPREFDWDTCCAPHVP